MGVPDILFPRGVQRILASLLLDPGVEFRHTELVARAGPGRGGGQNAIRGLLSAGVAKSRRSGNQVLVSANRSHPLFAELRSLCLKTFGIADRIRGYLQPWSEHVELAFVYGEVVGGTGRAGGPVRLIVVGRPDPLALRRALGVLEADLARTVDLNVYEAGEWETLRGRPGISGIIDGPKIMVTGDDPAPRHGADLLAGAPAPQAFTIPDPAQVVQLVSEAEAFLADSRTRTLSAIGRYHLASEGIHRLALAVLNHYSVGDDGGGQPAMALQALMEKAGLGTEAIRLVNRAYRDRSDVPGAGCRPTSSEKDTEALVQVLGTTFAAVRFLVEAPPIRRADTPVRRR